MGGNTEEIEIGSERELYKYINHQAGITKASTKIILVQMYNIFRLLIGVPGYSSESNRGKFFYRVHCYYFTKECL